MAKKETVATFSHFILARCPAWVVASPVLCQGKGSVVATRARVDKSANLQNCRGLILAFNMVGLVITTAFIWGIYHHKNYDMVNESPQQLHMIWGFNHHKHYDMWKNHHKNYDMGI